MTSIVINGNAYSDDGSTPQDMQHYGYLTHLLPMIGDTATVAGQVAIDAAQAAIDAGTASNGALALRGTSTTSLAVSAGTKTLTTQTGKQFTAGNYVTISRTSSPTTLMHGVVTSYSGSTLTVEVATIAGSGTFTDWTIALSGASGEQGPSGNGVMPYVAKTGAYTVVTTDRGSLIDCTSGTFTLGFQACATLGADWSVYIRNSGAGIITLDPNGGETIDGAATYTLYPNGIVIVQCTASALRVAVGMAKQRRLPILSATAAAAVPVTAMEDISFGVNASIGINATQVRYGSGLFVASGAASAYVASSSDGVTWTLRSMPSSANWTVSSDGTNFIASVPTSTVTASSTDGITWISATALPSVGGSKPACGISGVWLRTGDVTTNLFRSTNLGVSWSSETGPGGINGQLFSVSGYFWYVPFSGGGFAYYSTTGLSGSWTTVALPVTATNVWLGPDNCIYFSAVGVGAQVYKVVDKSTFTAVYGVTTLVSNTPVYSINSCYAGIGSTLGQTATFHATGKTYRASSYSVTAQFCAGNGGISVLPTPGFGCLTYTANNSPTGIFEG